MRIAPTTTVQAVIGAVSRVPLADEVTHRLFLATAGAEDGT